MIPARLAEGFGMSRFIEGVDRQQSTLFPECLEDWICEDNPVRVIDVFVGGLDLAELRFEGIDPEATGRASYHPSVLLKLYIYGYLNRVQSSRRLEREAGRNVEVMWLTGRLVPDHKTIADFRQDNGPAIRKVCGPFVALCRAIGLLTKASVAIDGSKFKAVNNRDKNFTRAKMERRLAQIDESVAVLEPARHGRPAGTVGSACRQDVAPQGQACQARERDGSLESDRESDARLT
jgi:transposase